ncbi:MAG: cytochrome c oxidase accessory protein CcoG [Bacteroidota bacterium]|nr:MAG: cytochrome c oxidase accessory protein CcoG [Bacteroidota bacterium]
MEKGAEDIYRYDDEFRDSIATVDERGKRVWIYPKKPSGYYHTLRAIVAVILLIIFFAGPFIRINGQPLLLLNFLERKFVIMGQPFWPQDFFLLALTLIAFFVFIILFTVVFGRVWCGWACPQTLFMEMVFRKIEYWIEGDAQAQRRLDKMPWNGTKITKKVTKHAIFILISVIIAHTALAYIIGSEETLAIVQTSPLDHMAGFLGLVAFTGIFYGVFARFREQACIAVCPYGRLQGVLLSRQSIVVAYDWVRGEPRAKLRKNEARTGGDCIDCKLCVHVCPTGIDIRNGTQLECVNCTACIDACDDVMVKIGRPKGLIRFASIDSIEKGIKKIISGRVIAYAFVLLALLGVIGYLVFTRSVIETTILKVPGTLYQRTEAGISNLYNVEFVNKTFEDKSLELRIKSPASAVLQQTGEKELIVPAEGILKSVVIVQIPESEVKDTKSHVRIDVYADGELVESLKTTFIGPIKAGQ